MSKVTIEQCLAIVQNQCDLNAKVNPNWINAGYPFHRAVWTEAAEALDHLPWEWWKAKGEVSPDAISKVHLELIDILHFGISHALSGLDMLEVYVAEQLHSYSWTYYDRGLARQFDLARVVRGLELIAGEAALSYSFSFEHFFNTAFSAGLTPAAIVSLYNGKNALNRFRQANGYKTGEYIKEWRRSDEDPKGTEDNDILYILAVGVAGDVPKSIEQIMDALALVYEEVKAFHTKG